MPTTHPSSTSLDRTVPDEEDYPLLSSLIDDLERYVDPDNCTPRRHDPVPTTRRFFVVEDHVFVGESIAHELAARRTDPLLILDDTDEYPDAVTGTTPDTYPGPFLEYLAASTHREVVVSLADLTALPTPLHDVIVDVLLNDCTFDPTRDIPQAFLEDTVVKDCECDPVDLEVVDGDPDNFLLIASEPGDEFLGQLTSEQRSRFGVRLDPRKHDGYTDEAFTRL